MRISGSSEPVILAEGHGAGKRSRERGKSLLAYAVFVVVREALA